MKYNFHTHTYRCLHAVGTEEDYIKYAVNSGLSVIGFSDHAPFPDFDFGLRMKFDELNDYIQTLETLKEKYKNEIQIFKGLEIEYQPKYLDYYRDLHEKYGLDYLALGEHHYLNPNGELNNIFFADSTEDYVNYAKAVCEAVQTGYFSFVAHPDIMFLNNFAWDNNCENACRMIVDCAEKENIILELNANGFRRDLRQYPDGVRYPYPDKRFWEMVRERNIRVIIGSDCHVPEQISDRYITTAEKFAENLGLQLTDTIF